MIEVRFYKEADDALLRFAVIIARSRGEWVFCKHRERDTWEIPGGHREPGEDILDTAKRELYEETGAVDYDLRELGIYSVVRGEGTAAEESFGMLYFAEIREFETELHHEMERIVLSGQLPERWTYPEIQPRLMEKFMTDEKESENLGTGF